MHRIAAVLALTLPAHAVAEPLFVPAQYPTIQAAIDAAQPGDEIHIAPGIYRELLDPENKSLTLIGAGPDQTILSGDLDGDTVADGVILHYQNELADVLPFITLDGIAMTDAQTGLAFRRAADVTISNAIFINCAKGIHLEDGQFFDPFMFDLAVTQSIFTSTGSGIDIQTALDITISDTTFTNLTDIAAILISETISITDSLVSGCSGLGLAVSAESGTISQTLFENNTNTGGHSPIWEGNSLSVTSLGEITIEQCDFLDNGSLNNRSHALDIRYPGSLATVTIKDCQFIGNRGSKYSAASAYGISHFLDCAFRNNVSEGTGPINFIVSHIPSSVIGCTFERNGQAQPDGTYIPAGGGGLCVEGGTVLIQDSSFTNNIASSAGAVMLNRGQIGVSRCTFQGNHASLEAGAIKVSPNVGSSITNSSFIGNTSRLGSGGAIWTRGDQPITNNAFIGNTAKHGNIVFARGTRQLSPQIPPAGFNHNLVIESDADSNSFESYFGSFPISEATNLITNQIQSVGFTRIPDHGGDGFGDDPRTPNIDESLNDDYGDLRLLPGSPAIDAGGNTKLPRDTYDLDRDGDRDEFLVGLTDLAGNPRFVDDPGSPNLFDIGSLPGPIDLGPYEYQPVSRTMTIRSERINPVR